MPPQEAGALGRLDHYEVLEVIGRGGMGIVLRAHDTKLRRVVALKLLAPALAAVGTARRRFAREAQSAAAVRDEHVVDIHEVCEDAAVPYLVMEFVSGITLEDRIRAEGPLPAREVARVGRQAAQGLAAAHAQGLVHRDVKPGNILLEGASRRVKLTDFGLARAADDASISRSGVIAGTPMYMSPEQAKGDHIDHRSDLFSLGSVLYTLCTGRPAFRAESTVAVLTRVCDDDPRPIREVNPDVPKWVCAVVEKLLAKDPAERVQSAAEVADLLGRYLAHLEDPDRVPPPPPIKGVRVRGRRRLRRPVLALVAAVAVAALGVVGYRAIRPAETPAGLASVEPPPGEQPPAGWNPPTAAELAARPSPLDGRTREQITPGLLVLAGGGDPGAAPPELVAVLSDGRFRLPKAGQHSWMATDREGKFLAVPNVDTVAIFDARTGELVRTLTGHTGRVYAVAFSPDGKFLAGGNTNADHTVKVWDLTTGNVTATLKGHTAGISSVAFSPDGTRLVSEGGDAVKLWDLKTGEVRRTLDGRAPWSFQIGFSPDGKRFVCGDTPSKTAKVFDTDTGELLATLTGHSAEVQAVAYSPDGRLLATSSKTELILWDADKLELVKKIDTPAGWLAFDPDGKTLLTAKHDQNGADRNHVVTRWDLTTFEGKPLPPLSDRAGWSDLHLSPDGKTLYANLAHAENDQLGERYVRAYDTATGKELFPLQGHTGQVLSVVFSPDGKRIASVSDDPGVRIWDVATGTPERLLPNERGFLSVVFSPDGSRLAAGDREGKVALFDATSGEQLRTMAGPKSDVRAVAFSPDGSLVAGAPFAGVVNVWEVASGRLRHALSGRGSSNAWCWSVAFSPDGKTLATGWGAGAILLFDVTTGWEVADLKVGLGEVRWLGFHPDGRSLGAAGNNRAPNNGEILPGKVITFGVWDLATRKETRRIEVTSTDHGHVGGAWRADGLLMASCGANDGTVRLWSTDGKPDRNQVIRLFRPPVAFLHGMAISPEGRHLATANPDGTVTVLRLAGAGAVFEPVAHAAFADAEFVLSLGGAVRVNDQDHDIRTAADLPPGPFRLTGINLDNTQVTDAELLRLKDCSELTSLSLVGTPVGDPGVGRFKDCKKLTDLNLHRTQVSDVGAAHFKDRENLMRLWLHGTKVTDAGLVHFQNCKNVKKLWLFHTRAGDAGLAHFSGCTNLTFLNLSNSAVTDAGLAHLAGMGQLAELDLTQTKVTAKGVQDLAKTLPKCKITWDEGTVEPKK